MSKDPSKLTHTSYFFSCRIVGSGCWTHPWWWMCNNFCVVKSPPLFFFCISPVKLWLFKDRCCQMRTAHIPLFHYIFEQNPKDWPYFSLQNRPWECGTFSDDVSTTWQESTDLDILLNQSAPHHPTVIKPIANFTSSTWKLKSQWGWAEIKEEATPKLKKKHPD